MKKILLSIILLFSLSCQSKELKEPELYKGIIITARLIHEGDYNKGVLTRQALEFAASTFADRMVILGHDGDPRLAVGRVLRSELRLDKEKDKVYIWGELEIKDEDAVKRVKLGLFYYLSVGFRIIELDSIRSNVLQKPVVLKFVGQEVSFTSNPMDQDAHLEK